MEPRMIRHQGIGVDALDAFALTQYSCIHLRMMG